MASIRGVDWAAPTAMLLALITGILFALGHHLFYDSLAGGRAPVGTYKIVGANVSKQQFNTAIGTAFAFVVKALLTLAVGIAYTQVFWRAARTANGGIGLSRLDTLSSILANVVGFVRLNIWWRHPILLLLAAVAWHGSRISKCKSPRLTLLSRLIPIASIVTPATLSVNLALANPPRTTMARVPIPDFVNLNFAAGLTAGGPKGHNYTEYCYGGPSQPLQRVATAVSAQGEILPIAAPQVNASWLLDFWGPALQCASVNGSQRYEIWDNVSNFLSDETRCRYSYGYLSWMETSTADFGPFINANGKLTLSSASLVAGVPAAVYFAAIPSMFQTNSIGAGQDMYPGGCMLQSESQGAKNLTQELELKYFANATLLRCDVVNSSYTTTFHSVNGVQRIDITVQEAMEPSTLLPVDCMTGPEDPYQAADSVGIDQAMANLRNAECSTLNMNSTQCLFDPVLAQVISYQSIVAAFFDRVSRSIGLGGPSTTVPSVDSNSSVVETILMDTEEVAFIATWHMALSNTSYDSDTVLPNLQTIAQMSDGTSLKGLVTQGASGSRGSLGSALEQLFQNITMSVLSEPYLQPNASSAYAPPALTNVTLMTYDNVYVYAAMILWTAYGLAVLFTTLAIGVGLGAMYLNGASFDGNFSTVLRVGRVARLTEPMRDGDGDGHQPLPKHLKTARLVFQEPGYKLVQAAVT